MRNFRSLESLRSVRVRAVMSLGVVAAVGASGTFALWNDSVTISGTQISSGSIDLVVNGDTSDAVTSTTLNVGALLPNGTTAGVLRVTNTGLSPLKYYATEAVSGTVFPANVLSVTMTNAQSTRLGTGGTGDTCNTGTPYASTDVASAFVPGNFIGSASAQRALAPNATEYFCVQATLASDADQGLYSAKTSNVTITFTATQ